MGAPFDSVDAVGKGKDVLSVAIVPLHGDLDIDALFFSLEVDHVGVDGALGAVQVFNKRDEPALVEELMLLLTPLVLDRYAQPLV